MNNEGISDWLDEKLVLALVLLAGLAATGYWGYGQYTTLTQVQTQLDNRYQQSYQGLNDHIDALQGELGALVVSDSADNLSVNLSNTWRSAHSAQEDLGQLPLNSDTLDNLKGLLANVSQYANHLDRKVVDRELNDKEKQVLKKFHTQMQAANRQLEIVHNKMEKNEFTWYDKKRVNVEKNKKEYSASPLSGLVKLDGNIKLTDIKDDLESVLPENLINANKKDVITGLSELNGGKVNQKKAIKLAKKYIKNPNKYNYEVTDQNRVKVKGNKTVKANLPAHSVKATHKEDEGRVIYVDVSKHGGQVIWLLNQRGVGEKKVNLETARDKAADFLEQNGYENMLASSTKKFNKTLIASFIPVQNGVLLNPDAVTVEIALDNGEITGFNGIDYALNHKKRSSEKLQPKLSLEEAKKRVSKNLQLTKKPRLVLSDIRGEEKLCYEFVGEVEKKGQTFSVKINAMDGKEEVIKNIDDDIYKTYD
ncbi:germination protein YpeB [Halanaerocella petrolearia]